MARVDMATSAVVESLYELAKLLLGEDDPDRTAEVACRRLLELTEAERGFIVVREGSSYVRKFDVRFDPAQVSADERRISRTLVRRALESGNPVAVNLPDEAVDVTPESIARLGPCSVLVAPLLHGRDIVGAIYLDRARAAAFSSVSVDLVQEFAGLAAQFIRRALEHKAERERRAGLERDLFARHDFGGIVTRDERMLALLKVVAQVADTSATVLITGETGTGKELVARALHVNSERRQRPFVTLHCSALPTSVLESELFGHVRGAFTGADRDRAGRIASADGGTLFLDEIGEIAPELQAKLLRFLQFGEIQRVGSDRTDRVNVRVIAATHRDLAAAIGAGRFRQDLYYRLKVIELHVPPLRERRGDIPLLLEHFLQQSWKRPGPPPRLSARAAERLLAHEYPGNVRELGHILERAALLCSGAEIDADLLPAELAGATPSSAAPAAPSFARYRAEDLEAARSAAVAAVERMFLDGLMRECENNVSLAARQAGIHRSHLQRLLARHRS
jgi:Nif-specific regulatory protein/two-component system response regulator HydG